MVSSNPPCSPLPSATAGSTRSSATGLRLREGGLPRLLGSGTSSNIASRSGDRLLRRLAGGAELMAARWAAPLLEPVTAVEEVARPSAWCTGSGATGGGWVVGAAWLMSCRRLGEDFTRATCCLGLCLSSLRSPAG